MQIDQESLEILLITIAKLKSEGKYVTLLPSDVLQSWVLEQLPEQLGE